MVVNGGRGGLVFLEEERFYSFMASGFIFNYATSQAVKSDSRAIPVP